MTKARFVYDERIQDKVRLITDYLRKYGKEFEDCFVLECPASGPYLEFSAELQEWPDGEFRLFVGYYFEQNGDLCSDPLLQFWINRDKVTMVSFSNGMCSAIPCDPAFANEFLCLILQRHFQETSRCTRESREGGAM